MVLQSATIQEGQAAHEFKRELGANDNVFDNDVGKLLLLSARPVLHDLLSNQRRRCCLLLSCPRPSEAWTGSG